MRVGFIGLGSQGAPMARRIAEAGHPTTLWARRPESLTPFADTPAQTADSPAALAAASDIVCICVVTDADVEEVVTAPNGVLAGLAPNGIIVIHSTVHPDTCTRLATQAATQGITLIDAPVSGGPSAAAEGHLLIMAGGPTETITRCHPIFTTYANPIIHLGPTGSGQLAKLLNNTLFTANLATASGTLALAESLGINPLKLAEVASHGSGASFALSRLQAAGGTLAPMAPKAAPLLQKDLTLLTSLLTTASIPPNITLQAAQTALTNLTTPH